ncbi:MAG: hypothetical protein A2X48_14285 [Lentisphaerae bacterium GWF2_49_21]|nr:MAG: hypothetical protein A2X48_14285 [Lentisphaerae bacterium GWF2_49_21]
MSFFRKYLKIRGNDRILDVACGIGVYANRLAKRAACVVGFDLSYNNIAIANHIRKDNTFFYCGNAEEICHPNNSFDIVISICAIEHFNDSKKSIAEMFRVLKPGGQLLVTVDSLENINSREFIEFHRKFCLVQKYYTVGTVRKELEAVGFEIRTIKPILVSPFSATMCKFAFKIMKWPMLFGMYSLLAYQLTLILDKFSSDRNSGIIIAVYALKTKE